MGHKNLQAKQMYYFSEKVFFKVSHVVTTEFLEFHWHVSTYEFFYVETKGKYMKVQERLIAVLSIKDISSKGS